MKFGKHLIKMIELSDPEWGPYWLNYKFMKKKINDIVKAHGAAKVSDPASACNPLVISQSPAEVEFFRLIRAELKKTSYHFSCAEKLCVIRHKRVKEAYLMLHDKNITYDKKTWTRLLMTCVKFYKDILLLENFAIINYCGFSKILKKHDKSTGYSTREAFMRNVMSHQNFTHYPDVLHLLQESEKLYIGIQRMERLLFFLQYDILRGTIIKIHFN